MVQVAPSYGSDYRPFIAKDDPDQSKGSTGEKDGSKRPTPRQSEKDVGASLGENGKAQVSFKDGAEVKYGTKDSVRPDWCVGNTCSIEVKNYNLEKNQSGLISNVSDQIVKRSYNLPEGMEQRVVIDIRGQNVSFDQENYIIKKIVERTKGKITIDLIEFKRK